MITPEEFDKICGVDYSKGKDESVWVVMATEPLPGNEEIDDFIMKLKMKLKKTLLENPGDPYCAKCWKKMEIEPDHMTCPMCGCMVCFREEE